MRFQRYGCLIGLLTAAMAAGCGSPPGGVAPGFRGQANGMAGIAVGEMDPTSRTGPTDLPPKPGCQRMCTMIGQVGPGPDPNRCWDDCSAQAPPPRTSSVPPGCQERCTASLPPQCQTVCPSPGTLGGHPPVWGPGGAQVPWPPPGQGRWGMGSAPAPWPAQGQQGFDPRVAAGGTIRPN